MVWTDPVTKDRWEVVVSFAETGGRMEPVAVELRPEGRSAVLSGEVLRRVPWGRLIRDQRLRFTRMIASGEMRVAPGRLLRQSPAQLAEMFAPVRGRTRTVEAHEETARIYREAWQRGASPTKAVAEAQGVNYSTASKRVMAARRAGYLPAAIPGKARA